MIDVEYFITSHDQTQSNRVCYFHLFGVVLASNESIFSTYWNDCICERQSINEHTLIQYHTATKRFS